MKILNVSKLDLLQLYVNPTMLLNSIPEKFIISYGAYSIDRTPFIRNLVSTPAVAAPPSQK